MFRGWDSPASWLGRVQCIEIRGYWHHEDCRFVFLVPSSRPFPRVDALLTANEYGGSMIRINAVCPGPIDTPLLERAVSAAPELRNLYTDSTAFKRFGDVDEVADSILYLVSPAGSYVHGTSLIIDGGYLNMA